MARINALIICLISGSLLEESQISTLSFLYRNHDYQLSYLWFPSANASSLVA